MIDGQEAKRIHLVSETFASHDALMQGALDMARKLASKSPLAIVGTKKVLLYQRDHTVQDGLDFVAAWNASMLPGSDDLKEVFRAQVEGRRVAAFSKL